MMLQHEPPKVHKKHAFLFDINLYQSNPIKCSSRTQRKTKTTKKNLTPGLLEVEDNFVWWRCRVDIVMPRGQGEATGVHTHTSLCIRHHGGGERSLALACINKIAPCMAYANLDRGSS